MRYSIELSSLYGYSFSSVTWLEIFEGVVICVNLVSALVKFGLINILSGVTP